MTEADTCRELVTPKLVEAGWSNMPHSISEQRTFTTGRIIVTGGKVRRGKRKRADYLTVTGEVNEARGTACEPDGGTPGHHPVPAFRQMPRQ